MTFVDVKAKDNTFKQIPPEDFLSFFPQEILDHINRLQTGQDTGGNRLAIMRLPKNIRAQDIQDALLAQQEDGDNKQCTMYESLRIKDTEYNFVKERTDPGISIIAPIKMANEIDGEKYSVGFVPIQEEWHVERVMEDIKPSAAALNRFAHERNLDKEQPKFIIDQ